MFSFCHNFCWLRDERFANHKILTDYCYEARWHNYRFTINRSFLNDRLSVAVYANMPFTTREKYRYRTVHGDYTGYNLSWDKTRFFGIRASWSFGKLKASVKKAERSIQNDDLVGGVKK